MKTPQENPAEGQRDANTRERLRQIGELINEELPQGWGYFLCAFPFNDGEGRCNYIANAKREDVITMLTNMLELWKQNPEHFGQHRPEKV